MLGENEARGDPVSNRFLAVAAQLVASRSNRFAYGSDSASRVRVRTPVSFCVFVLALVASDDVHSPRTPLPDAAQLRIRALAHMRESIAALERYSCPVETRVEHLDSKGRVQKQELATAERFFVNGVEIHHVLSRNGKQLTGADARKEQKRTDDEVKKYSNSSKAHEAQERREKQFEMFLRAHRLTNGLREQRGGRSTLAYDLTADPDFHPHNLEERFAHAMSGRIWIDEETTSPVEVRIETDRDVKIGAGLLATVHKGFHLHLLVARQPEGVWLTKAIEGDGDARLGLMFHPRVRFRAETGTCRLFSVDAQDVVHGPQADRPSR